MILGDILTYERRLDDQNVLYYKKDSNTDDAAIQVENWF
jgi:hypothetical protein